MLSFSGNVAGTHSKDLMDTILVIQYFDTMNAVVVYQSECISILLALPCENES